MKADEIEIGGTYTNGGAGVRTVTGDSDSRSTGQAERDEVQYTVVSGFGQGRSFSMTRAAFAKWAKARVEPEGGA